MLVSCPCLCLLPLGSQDHFYLRYMLKHNLFEPVMAVFTANGCKYNMINSAILELLDFVRKVPSKTHAPEHNECLNISFGLVGVVDTVFSGCCTQLPILGVGVGVGVGGVSLSLALLRDFPSYALSSLIGCNFTINQIGHLPFVPWFWCAGKSEGLCLAHSRDLRCSSGFDRLLRYRQNVQKQV